MSGKTRYRRGSDGLPARISGPWAEEKLDALQKYLSIFNTAMKNRWAARCYIDLLAGGGRNIDAGGQEFDGSPLLALKTTPQFTSVILVEADARLVAALEERTESFRPRTTILRGDCNDATTINAIKGALPSKGSVSVVFVDNLGLNVAFNTISRVVANRAMDLVVTFQVSDLKRNASRALASADESERWNRFFGSDGWRKVIVGFEARTIPTADLGVALGDYYGKQLMKLGYTTRAQLNRTMINTKGASLYRMMLFSKHPLAKKLFDASSAAGTQRDLFR